MLFWPDFFVTLQACMHIFSFFHRQVKEGIWMSFFSAHKKPFGCRAPPGFGLFFMKFRLFFLVIIAKI